MADLPGLRAIVLPVVEEVVQFRGLVKHFGDMLGRRVA
jgi:hypothetical protein